ncbi:MAG TPA: YfiR family protein [Chryseolinea sp.]|nr:YfiR family protein [Chryseolinea sp.]
MRAPLHFLLALLLLLCVLPAAAQNYKMHSVFVYSFTRYVIWPDTYSTGDFEILVLGDSPIIEELKAMAQAKKVGERPIKVTKISSATEIKKCNMLFVSSSKSALIPEVMEKINTQSILVISEEAGAGQKGSDINFIVKDGKLAFELNQASVTRQGLKVSNELSRLAILI